MNLVRSMDKELKREVKSVLESLATPTYRNDGERSYKFLTMTTATPHIKREAVDYLVSRGCLENTGQHSHIITATGRDYLEEISAWGPWYWFKNNWFPATVALATILVGASTAGVQIWGVLAGTCGTGP